MAVSKTALSGSNPDAPAAFFKTMPSQLEQSVGKTVQFFGSSGGNKLDKLKPAMQSAAENPRNVGRIFYEYYQTVKDWFSLPEEDMKIIHEINSDPENPNHGGADEFLQTFGGQKEAMLAVLRNMGNIQEEPTKRGLHNLSDMMNTAQTIKQKEPDWKPTDRDPRSDGVIWGFVLGADNPNTDIHFAVAHAMERVLSQKFHNPDGSPFKKDWFVHPLTDIIVLKGVQGKGPEFTILSEWSKARPEGLGWASKKRINTYKEHVYGRTFGDNTLIGDQGDAFFKKSVTEQILELADSEACPIPRSVIKRYKEDPEGARDRYGEIVTVRKLILETTQKLNPELYTELTRPLARNVNEPVGTYEPDAIPPEYIQEMTANNTPWGFSLPRILLDQWGKGELRTQERALKGLTILEQSINTATTPLEFMAVLANKAVHAGADIDAVLKSTISKGKLDDDNVRTLYQNLGKEMKTHAPTLWKRYLELTPVERTSRGIANIPQEETLSTNSVR